MATRQEIQVAQDLIRFTNIMNDLTDVMSYMSKEIDSETGMKLHRQNEYGEPIDMTLDELKSDIMRATQNIMGYYTLISNFFTKIDPLLVSNGLAALSVSDVDIKADLENIQSIAQYVVTNLASILSKEDLANLGDYIDQAVSKLPLVRRPWCLGL